MTGRCAQASLLMFTIAGCSASHHASWQAPDEPAVDTTSPETIAEAEPDSGAEAEPLSLPTALADALTPLFVEGDHLYLGSNDGKNFRLELSSGVLTRILDGDGLRVRDGELYASRDVVEQADGPAGFEVHSASTSAPREAHLVMRWAPGVVEEPIIDWDVGAGRVYATGHCNTLWTSSLGELAAQPENLLPGGCDGVETEDLVVGEDAQHVYVLNRPRNFVHQVDTATGAVHAIVAPVLEHASHILHGNDRLYATLFRRPSSCDAPEPECAFEAEVHELSLDGASDRTLGRSPYGEVKLEGEQLFVGGKQGLVRISVDGSAPRTLHGGSVEAFAVGPDHVYIDDADSGLVRVAR
jgi:hypothetical protein